MQAASDAQDERVMINDPDSPVHGEIGVITIVGGTPEAAARGVHPGESAVRFDTGGGCIGPMETHIPLGPVEPGL